MGQDDGHAAGPFVGALRRAMDASTDPMGVLDGVVLAGGHDPDRFECRMIGMFARPGLSFVEHAVDVSALHARFVSTDVRRHPIPVDPSVAAGWRLAFSFSLDGNLADELRDVLLPLAVLPVGDDVFVHETVRAVLSCRAHVAEGLRRELAATL